MDSACSMYTSMPASWVIQQVNRFIFAHKAEPFVRGRPHGFYIDGSDERTQIAIAHVRSGAAALDLGIFLHSDVQSSVMFESSMRWHHLLRDVTATVVPPAFLAQLMQPCTNFFVSASSTNPDTLVNQLRKAFQVDALVGSWDPATGECHVFVVQQQRHLVVDVIATLFELRCMTDITVVSVPKGDYSQCSSGAKTPSYLARQFIVNHRVRTGSHDISGVSEAELEEHELPVHLPDAEYAYLF
jgi:hypothetical protein